METGQHMRDTTESSSDIDLVIENLSEFAAGYAGHCGLCTCSTIADYVVGNTN
jgi:hypothetical protein